MIKALLPASLLRSLGMEASAGRMADAVEDRVQAAVDEAKAFSAESRVDVLRLVEDRVQTALSESRAYTVEHVARHDEVLEGRIQTAMAEMNARMDQGFSVYAVSLRAFGKALAQKRAALSAREVTAPSAQGAVTEDQDRLRVMEQQLEEVLNGLLSDYSARVQHLNQCLEMIRETK